MIVLQIAATLVLIFALIYSIGLLAEICTGKLNDTVFKNSLGVFILLVGVVISFAILATCCVLVWNPSILFH